jgi:Protein of unknown function (DUF559)
MSLPIAVDTPLLQAAIALAVAALVQFHQTELTTPTLYRRCESPLEAAFRVWWYVASLHRTSPVPQLVYQHDVHVDGRTYRLDVAIFDTQPDGMRVPMIAVELDGHTFHERTRQQVVERNARDRALQSVGWTVMHFSYDEISANGLPCAVEVLERFDALMAARKRTT